VEGPGALDVDRVVSMCGGSTLVGPQARAVDGMDDQHRASRGRRLADRIHPRYDTPAGPAFTLRLSRPVAGAAGTGSWTASHCDHRFRHLDCTPGFVKTSHAALVCLHDNAIR